MSRATRSTRDPKVSVLVTVDDAYRDALGAVAERLSEVGMNVVETLELGGVIVGDVAERDLAGLTRVKGVADVAKDVPFTAH